MGYMGCCNIGALINSHRSMGSHTAISSYKIGKFVELFTQFHDYLNENQNLTGTTARSCLSVQSVLVNYQYRIHYIDPHTERH